MACTLAQAEVRAPDGLTLSEGGVMSGIGNAFTQRPRGDGRREHRKSSGPSPCASDLGHPPIRRLEIARGALGVEQRKSSAVFHETGPQSRERLAVASEPQRQGLVLCERGRH